MVQKNNLMCYIKSEANALRNDASVKLVRLEDDSELLFWIANNLKTDFDLKTLKQQMENSTQQKAFIEKVKKQSYLSNNLPLTKKNTNMAAINKERFQKEKEIKEKSKLKQNLYKVNKNLSKIQKDNEAYRKRKLDNSLSSITQKIEIVGNISAFALVENEYVDDRGSDNCSEHVTSISNCSFDFSEEFCCNPHSQKKLKFINNTSSIRKAEADIIDLTLDPSIGSSGEKMKNSPVPVDVKESLNLISQLTGCSVNPSKVKVMPLSSADGNLSKEVEFDFVENEYEKSNVKKRLSSRSPSAISKHKMVKNDHNQNRNIKISQATDTRTIYDLMNDVSAILPSWNLHILPDSNTFCIGQVTRNKFGTPYLSKCIELDDNFNAKVYVYQQHCKKFDGTYDSEDMVAALINKVNHH